MSARLPARQFSSLSEISDSIAIAKARGSNHSKEQVRLRAGFGKSQQRFEMRDCAVVTLEIELRDSEVLQRGPKALIETEGLLKQRKRVPGAILQAKRRSKRV